MGNVQCIFVVHRGIDGKYYTEKNICGESICSFVCTNEKYVKGCYANTLFVLDKTHVVKKFGDNFYYGEVSGTSIGDFITLNIIMDIGRI